MKKISVAVISFFFSLHIQAQLFIGSGGAILNNGEQTYFNLSVSGLTPSQLNGVFGVEEILINITHPTVEELHIYLESPSGIIVKLAEAISCSGSDYVNTCFNNNASTSITLAQTPHTGSYKPVGYLGRFNNGQTGNGVWRLIVHDYLAFVNSGNVIDWSIKFSTSPQPPLNFTSSNLPIVMMNTGNQVISDSNTLVNMGIIYNTVGQRNNFTDNWNNYNGKAIVHFRGNSSKVFEKKPYSVETIDNAGHEIIASVLGMPPESDWHLIAMYQDKSLIRIPLTYEISRQMGHYAPRLKLIELVINNEYRGVYSFVEKPKWGKYRVDIPKLSVFDNFIPQVTGGYLFKIDRAMEDGWFSLFPGIQTNNSHFYYEYVYPKDTSITNQQKTYIKGFMDEFETVMNSSFYNDPVTGYRKYIDVGSFIDFFIINELSKNVDAYRLSTYLYKENSSKGGKLFIGPVWDYDLAWHNCNYGNSFDATGWEYQLTDTIHPTPVWWDRFMQDPLFVNDLYCRWKQLRQGILNINYLNTYINSTANELNESQQRNFIQWPILGAYIFPNPQNQLNATYQGEVDDLKNWITNRITWMDWAISGSCTTIGITEHSMVNSIAVFPNPFEYQTTFTLNLIEAADVYLKINDMLGNEVAVLLNEYKYPGEFKVHFNKGNHAMGIYFYQLKINNIIKTGKIIIQ